MGKVIYSMGVSLDGFIADPDGRISVVPDEELHRFHNEQARATGVHVYGRRLYEVMTAWDTYAEENPSAPEHELDFARIWAETPKLVFSRTLDEVGAGATLASGDVAETVAELKRQVEAAAARRADGAHADRDARLRLGRGLPPLSSHRGEARPGGSGGDQIHASLTSRPRLSRP